MGAVGNGIVGFKHQLRRVAQLQGSTQFPAQVSCGGLESLQRLFSCVLSRALT